MQCPFNKITAFIDKGISWAILVDIDRLYVTTNFLMHYVSSNMQVFMKCSMQNICNSSYMHIICISTYTLAPLASAYKWQCLCNACFCIYLRLPLCWWVWAARSGSGSGGPSSCHSQHVAVRVTAPGPRADCQSLRLPGVATVKVMVNVSPSLWLQVQVGFRARRRRTGPSDGRRAGPRQWSPAVSPPCHRVETPVRVRLQSKQLKHFYKICQNASVPRLVTPGGKTDDESTRSVAAVWWSAQWQKPCDTKRLLSLLVIRAMNIHRKV